MPTDLTPRYSFDASSASLGMLASLLDQSTDCIKVIGRDGALDYINRNGQKIMEVGRFADVSGQLWWDFFPEESRSLVKDAVARAGNGEATKFEAWCPTMGGKPIWWDVSVSPLCDDDGRIVSVIAISRDITERIRAREATEALAQEMSHRVRNAYSLSSALARSLARGEGGLESFADNFSERLMHLSAAQNLVMDSGGSSTTDLPTLVERLIAVYRGQEGSIEAGPLPNTKLNEKQAQALALAMGELATNSYKYGALGNGRTVRVSSCDRDGKTVLCWNEPTTRAGPREEDDRSHSGSQGRLLIKRFLTAVGGDISFDWRPGELAVSIRLPSA